MCRHRIFIAIVLACGCSAADRTQRAAVTGPLPPGMYLPVAAKDALIGVVVDGAGAPVAGAVVRFLSEGVGSKLEAVSNAEGMLHGALTAGAYTVEVTGPGLLSSTIEDVLWPTEALQLVASRAVGIAGQVVDGSQPLPGATVVVVRDNIEEFTLAADHDGRFAFTGLAQGTYRVYAYAGDLVARSRLVEQRAAEGSLQLTLVVEPGTIIVGAVRDDDTSLGVPASVLLMAVGHDEPPRLVQTNKLGEFRFEGVPRGRWQIAAAAETYLTSTWMDLAPTMASGAPLAIRIMRGETLRVRVVDSGGGPVAGASIWLQSEHDRADAAPLADAIVALGQGNLQLAPRAELGVTSGPVPLIPRTAPPAATVPASAARIYVGTVGITPGLAQQHLILPGTRRVGALMTDAVGELALSGLEAGTWRVMAQHADFVESAAVTVALPAPGAEAALTISLTAGGTIRGRTVSAHAGPLGGAMVTWQPQARGAHQTVRRTVSDANGEFVMTGLLGHGELLAVVAGVGETTVALTLREGDVATPTLVIVEQRGEILGTVVDQEGRAVVGAQVGIVPNGRSAMSDGVGAFVLRGVPEELATVRASHRDFLPVELQVRGDARTPQRVMLQRGAVVSITVLDRHTGMPVSGATAAMSLGEALLRATSDNQGQLQFRALAKGVWRLTLAVPGYVDVRREVDVAADQQEERVEFERGAMISGVVRDRYGGRLARVRVKAMRATDGVAVETLTNAEGAFLLRNAPTGEIELSASSSHGRAAETRTLRPGDELTSIELTLR